jgi:hypothetical protein
MMPDNHNIRQVTITVQVTSLGSIDCSQSYLSFALTDKITLKKNHDRLGKTIQVIFLSNANRTYQVGQTHFLTKLLCVRLLVKINLCEFDPIFCLPTTSIELN